jgi:predicted HicB family RNase H-like nuclease
VKRVINGKTYNTDTSTLVAQYEYEDDKGYQTVAEVYQNRGGAFFIVHSWTEPMPGSQFNEMIHKVLLEESSREEMERLIDRGEVSIEIINEDALAVPPEAEAEEEPATTAYLRLPPALKNRIEAAAKDDGLSLNAWAIRCFERCAEQKPPTYVPQTTDGVFDRREGAPKRPSPLHKAMSGPKGPDPL